MMAAYGLAKLSEELGELQQVIGKALAYGLDEHPDEKGKLSTRMEEEMADVLASIRFVRERLKLDYSKIALRCEQKYQLFKKWESEP